MVRFYLFMIHFCIVGGLLFELYRIHYDYHHPITATINSTIFIDNYLDFITNKTILLNSRIVIRCIDANNIKHHLRLDLKYKNNIWRFVHMYGYWCVPLRIMANVILNACGFILVPFTFILNPLIIPFSILYQLIEGFLDAIVLLPMIFLTPADAPPTMDTEPLLRAIEQWRGLPFYLNRI